MERLIYLEISEGFGKEKKGFPRSRRKEPKEGNEEIWGLNISVRFQFYLVEH